ncbi:CDK-activating kinase assembly factor MAT1 [Kwoniella dejecticola CBS 10117]|uniref:RNA polymerase II transcription factor B subunit 3 n=1 Tax=Kwoniella dejecticola CBS 10117 TaxID=1296121 RepID=A0A1A5ZUQ7_9TREE|nr:CDK-activating kinase assembly factor MAT1 [Kwoniella dejecticola CBS 10117]OBR81539.1 CDK-activating kinase assembly factor MAT1 [Kwoniella dejecticola CBS 10117]
MSSRVPMRRAPAASSSSSRKPQIIQKKGQRVGTNAKGTEDGYLYVAGVKDPSKRVSEFRTDQDVCPICHTDRQFNQNLRLLVSPCYHKMCESCIDRLFTLGPEPCPQCGRILRKVNFAHQTFEDLKVEKEVAVRRRMAQVFNKRRDDFGSDKEYDNYLEEVEDLTFNLLNDIDIDKTEKRIQEFQKSNASLIATNQEKAALEAMSQTEREEVERRAREERMRMVEEAERIEREEEERAKKDVTEALARGESKRAREIELNARNAKQARQEALFKFIPPALLQSTANPEDEVVHLPTSPSYHGPFVPIPYSDPTTLPQYGWYEMKEGDYVDGRSGVQFVLDESKNGEKVRGGGWDLRLFWEMEVRCAVEGLGVEPLV